MGHPNDATGDAFGMELPGIVNMDKKTERASLRLRNQTGLLFADDRRQHGESAARQINGRAARQGRFVEDAARRSIGPGIGNMDADEELPVSLGQAEGVIDLVRIRVINRQHLQSSQVFQSTLLVAVYRVCGKDWQSVRRSESFLGKLRRNVIAQQAQLFVRLPDTDMDEQLKRGVPGLSLALKADGLQELQGLGPFVIALAI